MRHTRYGRPQDDPLPREDARGLDEGDHVDERGEGGEAADDDGVDEVGVGVLALDAGVVEVLAIEADDGKREDELQEAQGRLRHEADEGAVRAAGGFAPTHVCDRAITGREMRMFKGWWRLVDCCLRY